MPQYRKRNFLLKGGPRTTRGITLDPDLIQKLRRAANRHHRSLDWFVEDVLSRAVEHDRRLRRVKHMMPAWGEEL